MKPRAREEPRTIETAADVKRHLEHLADRKEVAVLFNAFASTGNAANFWLSYQKARAAGPVPEAILRVLDSIVADLLKATSNDELAHATGLQRRAKGGAGRVAKAKESTDTHRLCVELWMEHLRVTGKGYAAGDSPPERLAIGVCKTVAKANEMKEAALRQRYCRWRTSLGGNPPDLDLLRAWKWSL